MEKICHSIDAVWSALRFCIRKATQCCLPELFDSSAVNSLVAFSRFSCVHALNQMSTR